MGCSSGSLNGLRCAQEVQESANQGARIEGPTCRDSTHGQSISETARMAVLR